jgi:endonuclease III
MTPHIMKSIFDIFVQENPVPRTELHYRNGFTLVAAVLLSAQATDIGVNKATKALFDTADTPEKMVDLGIDTIKDYIKTIGLYHNKAKNLFLMSQMLMDKFNGQIPNNLNDLMALPGVGRKTANVVLNELYHIPTIAVDTHVFRVANRTGIATGKNELETEENLLKNIPEPYLLHAHHHLILHGRYICKARKPECTKCKIINFCEFPDKIL